MTAIHTMLSYNQKNDYEVAFLISKVIISFKTQRFQF